jgi:uncharacterized protein (DUF1810 family)
MDDPYNLQRFVDAQARVFEGVLSELRRGEKCGHWMWFIFPQIKGLGFSSTSQAFAIQSLDEAQAYLAHPLLGPRLGECTNLVNLVENRTVEEIFGYPDDMKFKSSMTLFSRATNENDVFLEALQKYFQGELDQRTLARI